MENDVSSLPSPSPAGPASFSLLKRVQLCSVMLALESYISFEEIFMLALLQRLSVPTALVSLPGTISSFIGVFIIPLLGWASDRFTCKSGCGQKRPYAVLTLAVCTIGMSILTAVNLTSLYHSPDRTPNASHVTAHTIMHDVSNGVTDIPTKTAMDINPFEVTVPNDSGEWGFDPVLDANSDAAFSGNASLVDNSTGRGNSWWSVPVMGVLGINSTGSGNSWWSVPVMGVLGIAGFVLADHGYDSSMSTTKAYMVAVTPPPQHSDIFVMGTLTGAVGGCLTSLLGFVDLAVLFPQGDGAEVIDKGVAQCLVQAAIVIVSLGVLGGCTLLTGSESADRNKDCSDSDPDSDSADEENRIQGPPEHNRPRSYSRRGSFISESAILAHSDHCSSSDSDFTEQTYLLDSRHHGSKWGRSKKRVFLCIMTFLGLSTNYAYFVYVTNFVAEVIYNGDPYADPDSDAYSKYVDGVHMASLGMLTFYCLFVTFNVLHNKILALIGMRVEYLLSSLCCCGLTLTLAFTRNIIVFFVNAVAMSSFRSAVYTIPFILSNNYLQEDKADAKKRKLEPQKRDDSGVAMASITAMIPASYFLVSLVMGPLMQLTGSPASPLLFSAGSAALGILSTFLVQF